MWYSSALPSLPDLFFGIHFRPDLPAKRAARLLKELRADLAGLEASDFFDKWVGADAEDLQ